MNGGYPTGGGAAAARGSLSGSASAAAFLAGARGAAMLARLSPYGAAVILAWELAEMLRRYREGVPYMHGFTQINKCRPEETLWKNGPLTCGAISGLPSQWPGPSANTGFVAAGYPSGNFGIVSANYQRNPGYTGPPITAAIPAVVPKKKVEPYPYGVALGRPLWKPVRKVAYSGLGLAWGPYQATRAGVNSVAGYSVPGSLGGLVWGGGIAGPIPDRRPQVIPLPGVGVVPEGIRPGVVPIAPGVNVPVVPGVGAEVIPRAPAVPDVRPIAPTAIPARPTAPLREVKAQVSTAMAGFSAMFGSIGEVGDFVDALHDALPDCRKTKSPKALRQAAAARRAGGWNNKYRKADVSAVQKILDVGRFMNDLAGNPRMASADVCRGIGSGGNHWTDGRPSGSRGLGDFARSGAALDHAASQFVDRALKNLVNNQLEDAAYGALGKWIGSVSRSTGLPVGLQTVRRVSQFKL